MRKQLLLTGLLFLLSITMVAQKSNNKYENEWKQVEQFSTDDLPQSALTEVNKILQKAISEKNNTQVIKALIYKNKYKRDIDYNDNEGILNDLQELIDKTNNVSEKALLQSMLAEAFLNYYSNDSWQINRRTALTDLVPADIKEWTGNIFCDKVKENINLSVKDVSTLKKHTTKEFDDIINLGKDTETYPTLYDFLMKRAIEVSQNLSDITQEEFNPKAIGLSIERLTLSANEYVKLNIKTDSTYKLLPFTYYQQYFKDILQRNMPQTEVLTEISKIEFLRNKSRFYTQKDVLNTYFALEKEYEKNNACAEIINKIVESYNYGIDNMTRAEINKVQYDWLKKGIDKYPDSYGARLLKSKLVTLESSSLVIKGKSLEHPDSEIKLSIEYKNTQTEDIPSFKLYKVESEKYTLIKEYPLELISRTTYNADTLPVSIGKLQPGRYVFSTLSTDKLKEGKDPEGEKDVDYYSNYDPLNDNRFDFTVSALMSFSRNSAKNEYEIFVVDRNSGKPVKDATIKVYSYETDENTKQKPLLASLKTNELGITTFKDTRDRKDSYYVATYKVELGIDSCLQQETLSGNSYRWNRTTPQDIDKNIINIFTDRSIYRPGQTIYFKAIITDNNYKPLANTSNGVVLFDSNNEIVSKKEIITNEFGSISGEFVLPQKGLLGQYSLMVSGTNGSELYYFKVEEYKRPTFDITFDKINETYGFGEEIKLKGYAKNFSGVNLQDTDVKYTITREQFSFWRWGGGYKSPFDKGSVKTNDDGSFEITFTPQPGEGNSVRPLSDNMQNYTFEVTATVTDTNGETQSNKSSITVGNISMAIKIDIPLQLEKSSEEKISITAKNLQGQDIETSGTYNLYILDKNDSIQSQVSTGAFKSGEQSELKSTLRNLSSGKYRLQVKALDKKNNEIIDNKNFILYSYSDKKPPIKTNNWLVKKNLTFSKNKPAEVIYGVSDKDIYVLYQLNNNQNIFERRFIKMSDANQLFSVPYKAEYGDEIYMSFIYVKDGKMYNQNVSIKREEEKKDTKLILKTEVFRDKLRPGQDETWTISVKDTTNNPVKAELLASMYDTSLDLLYPSRAWFFQHPHIYTEPVSPIRYDYQSRYSWSNNQQRWFTTYAKGSEIISGNELPPLSHEILKTAIRFDQLNWFGYIYQNAEEYIYGEGERDENGVIISVADVKGTSASGVDIAELSENKVILQESVVTAAPAPRMARQKSKLDGYMSMDSADAGGAGIEEESSAPQIRQNFNETAFFFPQLRTNEKGETLISFTVPESNTTWRFRAIAHDKNARVGSLEEFVVTQKELMVTPNMPRFVRQGDKTSISTKISNLSDNVISGDVHIEFFDPATDKTIDLNIANQKQIFSVEKEASTSASWTFDIPNDIELIGCRIIAQNATFSDGEQHVLPVLSNRMLVTESMPIDVTKAGTSTFTFDKLYNNTSATSSNYKLTLEYASNPAWYAVQALPTLSNPTNENAVNWFASYYVNQLGASIIHQYPKITNMINSWKKQGGDKQTLISKLQKDEELKAVLLEETPWVLEAKTETEQMQRLSLLFDMNNTKQQTDAATNKLKELMQTDGGWSWYKGMYPSRSITQYILYGYANLQLVGQVQYPQEIKMMQMDALKFIDKKITEDFENLKKYNKNWEKTSSVSTNQLEFAYVRSFYRDIPINQEARAAERFYTDVASKNWTKLGLYERSILSVILKRNGDKELADKITKSIKEHAVTDKQGMFWPNNRSNVFMSMSAISVHTFLMDALKENGATKVEMNLMKQWLLNQKRTQIWETTHASIDAISALLGTGTDWFTGESNPVAITVGQTKIEPQNKELGTGYIKQTWDKPEIDNSMAKVEINSTGSEPAFGALYWQYYENLDKITSQKGELNIEKQLFKEKDTSSGKGLTQITENNPLTIGDKVIVRLTIKAERDFEFVQLKDMRAPCFEPIQSISGMKWAERLSYYQMPKDASTNFYFDHLPKGTYVLEYPVYVNRSGEYANGITTIQCMYAPEFVSHTQGIKVTVKEKQ